MASCRTLSARRRRHTWPSATFAAGGLTRTRAGAARGALAGAARAQDSAQAAHQAAEMRTAIEQIARDRPPQAEAAAREMVRRLQIERAALDSLRQRSLAEYWAEVAQLTV